MDYVLLVEPDMYPVASTFNRAALQREIVYAIRRSGKESLGWEMLGVFFLGVSLVPWHFVAYAPFFNVGSQSHSCRKVSVWLTVLAA